jgi:hypothetical protein
MLKGIMLALGIFVGIASTLVAKSFGITSTVGKAATFAMAFVLVFGGYSYWTRRSAPTSSPS